MRFRPQLSRRPPAADRPETVWPDDPAVLVARGFVPPPTEAEAVAQYRPLVAGHANYYFRALPHPRDKDDLVSVGNLAVVKAHRAWRPDRRVKFLTLLERVVPRAMCGWVNKARAFGFTRDRVTRFERTSDLAALLGRGTATDHARARSAIYRARHESIRRRWVADAYEPWEPADWEGVWRLLSARQAEVLRRRLHGETLEQISRDLGRTRERIRQIEARAVENLRKRAGHSAALRDIPQNITQHELV